MQSITIDSLHSLWSSKCSYQGGASVCPPQIDLGLVTTVAEEKYSRCFSLKIQEVESVYICSGLSWIYVLYVLASAAL